jgi:CMP/dCMP kinase
MRKIVVAIDGPAGAGKSTISKIIAKKLELEYIDTGAMYRAVTLKMISNDVNIDNDEAITKMLADTKIAIEKDKIILDGNDVSEAIRMPNVNNNVSMVATKQVVREKLVELQRDMSFNKNIIMDGRDIGTYVLTNANYKIFLTASVEERARRRFCELNEKGLDVNYNDIYTEIEQRDLRDCTRELNPLKQAEDAILVNTTGKNIQQVVEEIIKIIDKQGVK